MKLSSIYVKQFKRRGRFYRLYHYVTAAEARRVDDFHIEEKDAGLTLVELLVVLSILGLFAALAAPQVLKYLGSAKTGTAKTQLSNIQSAVELYYLDVGAYPPANIGLLALSKAPPQVPKWNGPYLKKKRAVIDPWGRPYQYSLPGKHGAFNVFSFGRDGQRGGSGEDQDILSW